MWQKRKFACTRLLMLLLVVVQQHVMAAQTVNMAQMQNQQHQQTTLSQQQQQHHAPAPLQQQQQHIQPQQQQHRQLPALTSTTHPGDSSSSSSGSPNTGHHLASSSSSSSSSVSSPSTSASSTSAAHLPAAQFVNDKEAAAVAMQEVLQHFTADDDLSDTYQMLSDLKREVNSASGLQSQAVPPPPPPPRGATSNYPWNLFERAPYPSPSPYGAMPIPTMSPFAGLFPHMFNPYEGYHPATFPVTPRFMPFMSYAQPILVPYPLYMAPEMFYPGFSSSPNNDFDESMSRGAGAGAGAARRPSSQSASGYSRNSPIYYVRLPPTPYMFLSGLGGLGAPSSGYPAMMPYQSLPSFPSFSSIFNVPVNFLANGKPASVYQMGGSPNDVQGSMQFSNMAATNYPNRPPLPAPSHSAGNGYRPTSSTHNYFSSPPHSASSSTNNYGTYPSHTSAVGSGSSPQSLQDSKLTSLKRPYFFNGRPEDIYILPNNYNSLYSSDNSYY